MFDLNDLPKRKSDRIIGSTYSFKGELRIWDGRKLRCKHNREKPKCIECAGGSICEHNRERAKCGECGGGSICEHNRERTKCKICGGGSICEHNRERPTCIICSPNNAIAQILRSRLRSAIKIEARSSSITELIGCTIQDFRKHLESRFQTGMTWENYGAWHIDHRKPCSAFDFNDYEQQMMCFHYTNLQPMWASENLSKADFFKEDTFSHVWTGNRWVIKC